MANVAVHGIDPTCSTNPPGIDDSQPDATQPSHELVGFGTRNASRSRPGGLLRQSVRGAIHCRSERCAAITVNTGESTSTHVVAATPPA